MSEGKAEAPRKKQGECVTDTFALTFSLAEICGAVGYFVIPTWVNAYA